MKYIAIVRLEGENGLDVWKCRGHADKVLAKALNYLNKKGSESSFKRFGQFLKADFKEFESMLQEDLCPPKK